MPLVIEDAVIVSGIGAVFIAGFKIVQILLDKYSGNSKKEDKDKSFVIQDKKRAIFTDEHAFMIKDLHENYTEDRAMIQVLYDIHNVKDDNGVPLVYVPRAYMQAQDKIMDTLSSISSSQEKTAYILDKLLTRVDNLFDQRRIGLKD